MIRCPFSCTNPADPPMKFPDCPTGASAYSANARHPLAPSRYSSDPVASPALVWASRRSMPKPKFHFVAVSNPTAPPSDMPLSTCGKLTPLPALAVLNASISLLRSLIPYVLPTPYTASHGCSPAACAAWVTSSAAATSRPVLQRMIPSPDRSSSCGPTRFGAGLSIEARYRREGEEGLGPTAGGFATG